MVVIILDILYAYNIKNNNNINNNNNNLKLEIILYNL